MARKKALVLSLVAASLLTGGCARKQIDVDRTGSERVEGTNWYRFCDGPNAVMWTKGLQGDSDEIEAYVYDHWACAPEYYGEETEEPAAPHDADGDGLLEEVD